MLPQRFETVVLRFVIMRIKIFKISVSQKDLNVVGLRGIGALLGDKTRHLKVSFYTI